MRKNTASITREHKFLSIDGTDVSKNFNEIVRVQSEKRRGWIGKIKGERLPGIAESTSSDPRLASSSTASFPGRSECPGTHCSLIEKKKKTVPAKSAREIEVKGKTGKKTRWRGQSESQRGGEEKWQTSW